MEVVFSAALVVVGILAGVLGYWLGRRNAPAQDMDTTQLMRQIATYIEPRFHKLSDEIGKLHQSLERVTPQKILGEWLHLLERSSPGPEHIEALRAGILFLQEANRVPTLNSALVEPDFADRLMAVAANFEAIQGVEVPTEDITKAAGLVVLANQVEDLAETGVRTLSFEERFELLKATMRSIHAAGNHRSQLQYFTMVADAFSEACHHCRWTRYEGAGYLHHQTDFEKKLQRFLKSGQVPYLWRKNDSMFRSLAGWIVEAHNAGERFRSEAETA